MFKKLQKEKCKNPDYQPCYLDIPNACVSCKTIDDCEKILAEKVEEFYDFLEKQMDYSLKNKWTSTACILDLVSNEINKIFKSEAKQ